MPTLNSLFSKLKNKRGFTLIELLVVISIIAILITMIVATFGTTQEKARDSRRKTDLDAFKKALELHKSDTTGASFYPDCASDVQTPEAGLDGKGCRIDEREDFNNGDDDTGLSVAYMKTWPQEPRENFYIYEPTGCAAAGCSDYTVTACMENPNDSDSIPLATPYDADCSSEIYGSTYQIVNP